MALWVVEFSNGRCKIRKISPKNQHPQRKLLNFENWVNGEALKLEVSKIEHHLRKLSDLNMLSKNVNNKNCPPKLIFLNEKK